VKLPPRLVQHTNKRSITNHLECTEISTVVSPIVEMPKMIELEFAKANAAEPLWNSLIQRYHYLGHRVQVGRCMKYLIRGDGMLLGAISFSSPAWRLAVRDKLLEQIGIESSHALDLVINNSRFCILPHVRVPHLASRVLACATRQIVVDWFRFYSIEPLLAETFVEPTRFEGTCYRAANWNEIGMTNGFGKVGGSHHNSQQPKRIFIYGLTRACRRRLTEMIPTLSRTGASH
jgi:hypothetical protein